MPFRRLGSSRLMGIRCLPIHLILCDPSFRDLRAKWILSWEVYHARDD